jgi:perosamine synthetase
MDRLALYDGEKVKKTPFGSGQRFGEEEKKEVLEALEANTLMYCFGTKTKRMEQKMCKIYGVKHAIACSSGTASIHAAIAALGIGPGDEVLVPAITDMGSVIGVLYQNAIPIFLDVDGDTFNIDIDDIEKKITERTKAIIVVHHMGYPCDMDRILEIARKHEIKVVEDCAQAWHARYGDNFVGTMGDVGCFSFNDYKHLSTGEGGLCITNDTKLAENIRLYTDKGYYRDGSGRKSSFLAPNYRISEICSAVAIGQLSKLDGIVERRRAIALELDRVIGGIKGLYPARIPEKGMGSYWKYLFRFDASEFGTPREEFLKALQAEGIECGGSHIPVPVYKYEIFENLTAFSKSNYPFKSMDLNSDYSYDEPCCPKSQKTLDDMVVIPITEFYTDDDVKDICLALRKIATYYLYE